MQFKKIVPLALTLTLAATTSARAAAPQADGRVLPPSVVSQARAQLDRLLGRFDQLFAQLECVLPDGAPEETPDSPEQTPDTEPDAPEQLPEETPDETPDQPGEIPEPDPDLPEQTPEEIPDETPDQPDEIPEPDPDLPEQMPDEVPDTPPQQPQQPPADESPAPETPDDSDPQGDFAAQVAALVNAARAEYGLPALTVDAKVQQAAQVRARESAQSFSHTRPDGSSFSTALTEAGVSYIRSGENIAYGQTTPQQVVQAWMDSAGHRANILDAGFTHIGVGHAVVNGTAYWAQLFTA